MPDLVLIPGLLCSPVLWAHQRAHLASLARVSVADVTTRDSLEGMARVVLEQAPERFALAGLSMGCMVAYDVLWKFSYYGEYQAIRDHRLSRLITLGSPLGNGCFDFVVLLFRVQQNWLFLCRNQPVQDANGLTLLQNVVQ